MKLKNKKTGEIVEAVIVDHGAEWELELRNAYTNEDTQTYDSLTKLNAEWEDAPEEPKEYWYLENNGDVDKEIYDGDKYEERMIEIGNYFDTREEAEKAVEKLEAWKRLRDKGFKFVEGYLDNNDDFIIKAKLGHVGLIDQPDVSLLFGGKE